jgi:pimeloyl-ACP methyl ester carboxylesterase
VAEKLSSSHPVSVLAGVSHVPFVSRPDAFIQQLKEGWQKIGVLPAGEPA